MTIFRGMRSEELIKVAEKKANVVMIVLYAGVFLIFAIILYHVIADVVRGTFGWKSISALSFTVVFPATFGAYRLFDLNSRRQSEFFDEHGVSVSAESEIVNIKARYSDEYNSRIRGEGRANSGRYFMAEVETRYTVGERMFTIKDEMQANKKMIVGDKKTVTLRYDPDHPEWTDISPWTENPQPTPLSLRLLGLLCFLGIVGGIVFFIVGTVKG